MREAEFGAAIAEFDQVLADSRFGIYRNNVASGLTNAIRVRYPVVEQLVGPEFFAMMGRAYTIEHKPSSAMLIDYGAEFPEFVSSFAPAAPVPYLADVARLESAWWMVYHAANTAPLDKDVLVALAPEAWGETHLQFLPYAKILNFEYSAVSIWRGHHNDGLTMPSFVSKAEFALVHREASQVIVHTLTKTMYLFLNALAQGGTLLDAYEVASNHDQTFDILAAVQQLFHFNIIAEL